ncbi:winged helix-turn-helix domain-containing protein [Streptomyces capparidis]
MVYRIHFTAEDLARTRVARSPWPLWELALAVRGLQSRDNPARMGHWRREVLGDLPPQARALFELIPPNGEAPRFLTPAVPGSVAEVVEQVRSTPARRVRAELAELAAKGRLPSWAHRLADDRQALSALADTLAQVHARAIAPYCAQVRAELDSDHALRARELVDGGVERLLAGLFPGRVRWRPPVLELALAGGAEGNLYLRGQGLLLKPSAFLYAGPVVDAEREPQPVVGYPARYEESLPLGAGALTARPERPANALVSLLGRTRATVLSTVAERPGCTTTELAAIAGIALASASEHAAVLRQAGLIITQRHRNTALHSPTVTGMALLNNG